MNSIRPGSTRFMLWSAALLCAAIVAPVHAVAPLNGTPLNGLAISNADTWSKSVEWVRHGQFDRARRVLEKLAAISAAPKKAKQWMDEWVAEEQERQELTRKDHDDYVRRAKKWFDKGDQNRALKWAYWAKLNAGDDDDGFAKLAWVHQIKDAALKEADAKYDKHEWRDAHEYYYSLSLIFENDTDIEGRREDCLEHARLEAIYDPDRDWAETLEGITSTMVEEALYRIDRKYVEDADFKKLTVAGFKEMLLMAESPTLRKQFEHLTDDRGRDFVDRLNSRLRKIKEQPSLTYREALHHFRRGLKVNRQTAQLPEELVVKEYMNASLNQLDDFSSMIWPYDYREFEKHTNGDFVGVGIQIRNKYNPDLEDTEILVVSPLEDSPAYRAGIQAEDVIIKVNGKSLAGIPVNKAVTKITGPRDTTVTLTIRRKLESGEEKEIDFPLKRATIRIQSVKSLVRRTDDEQRWKHIVDNDLGIAYLRVTSFQARTISQMRVALDEAKREGMRGLILDLRSNPGGLLKAAVQMSEMFLPAGSRIVSTKGLHSPEWKTDSERDGLYKDVPLIVLINEASASASEIVSGAIKDHHRGLIIGERSFGKFSVQNLIQLVHSEAHLKLTTARYYLPSGRSLHREKGSTEWGVSPDVAVSLAPKEYSKILFMRRDADVIGAVKTDAEKELDEPLPPEDEKKSHPGDASQGDASQDDASHQGKGTPKEAKATQESDQATDHGDVAEDNDNDDASADNDDAAAGKDGKEKDIEKEKEEPDPNEYPRRDPQLETAILVLRMHLLTEDATRVANIDGTKHSEKVATE